MILRYSKKRQITRTILILFSVIISLSSLAENKIQPTVLVTFDNQQDINRWYVRKTTPSTVFKESKWPDNLPGKCVHIVYPKYKKPGEQWPAAILQNAHLPITDWRPYESISFDVYSKNPAHKVLNLYLINKSNEKRYYKHIIIKPGMQTITVPLSKFFIKDFSHITQLHLYMTRPEKDYELFIGPIKLNPYGNLTEKASRILQQLAQSESRLKTINSTQFPETLKAEWEKMTIAIPTCRKKLEESMKKAQTSLAAILKLKTSINQADKVNKGLLQLLKSCEMCHKFPNQRFGYGWLTSLKKVYRDDFDYPGTFGGTTTINVAKNEAEPIQLVLLPFQNLKNVKVTVRSLPNKDGNVLAASSLKVAPVGYVKTKDPKFYIVNRIGWHPDPILEYLPSCSLEALKWQSYWIEAKINREQKAGLYPCVAEISINGEKPILAPFSVRVYDFTLQEGSRLPLALSAFSYTNGIQVGELYLKNHKDRNTFKTYLRQKIPYDKIQSIEVKRAIAIYQQTKDLLFNHRLTADNIYCSIPPTVKEVKQARARGAKHFCIIAVPGRKEIKKGEPYPAKRKEQILKQLAECVPKYKKAGVLDMGYIYGFDEVSKNQFAAMKDIFGEIKKRYPTIPIMTTAYDHSYGQKTGLDDYVDIWVPLTKEYEHTAAEIEAARRRGRQVWWYICIGPKAPYANWLLEYPACDSRLVMGYMPYKYKTEGFLYYCLAMWRKYEADPNNPGKLKQSWREKPMGGGPLTDWPGYSWKYSNGDGNIVYPGPDGPIPSMRLKNICDGLEDYIYLKMLEDAVAKVKKGKTPPSPSWLNKAENCLKVNPELVETLTNYSLDSNVLLTERAKLASLLEQWAINNEK